MSLQKTALGVLAGATLFAGAWWALSPRITDRDVAFKINRGKLVDPHVSSGVKMDALLPHISYVKLPGYLQEVVISARENDPTNIRTKEETRIYGEFKVKYEINRHDKNIANLYTDLNVDDIEDLTPTIEAYVTPAIIDAYNDVPAADINKNILKIGQEATVLAQKNFNDRNLSYITIRDVVPTGTGLSAQANADLEKIVSENRKKEMLVIQEQVAEQSRTVTEKQTQVTIDAIKKLRESGMSTTEATNAYHLQLMRDNNMIGTPGVLPPTVNSVLVPSR